MCYFMLKDFIISLKDWKKADLYKISYETEYNSYIKETERKIKEMSIK